MPPFKRGIWILLTALALWVAYVLYQAWTNQATINPIPNKKQNHANYLTYKATNDTTPYKPCQPIHINNEDSFAIHQKLHLPLPLAARIVKYRKKIRFFQNEAQLKQVFSIHKYWQNIAPCVLFTLPDTTQKNISYPKKKQSFTPFNLNDADSAQLEKLPKIGPKFASRIIKFRNLLPFFVHLDQLQQVYGMNDTILQVLKERTFIHPPPSISKININQATYSELAKHPYIGKQNAKLITNYRQMHGNFHSLESLKNIRETDFPQWKWLPFYFECK